jgi:hypothetical protein|tara:strand:- start:817 stop:1014 length:198 start_codon:yes stop_codon:yes gene_type:complete
MAAPLTREDLTNINTALKAAKEVKAVIARAKQAGLDVDALEAQLLTNEARLQGIKAAFYPTGRAS